MSEARIHLDAQVQVRRDTEANWVAVDPVLRDGEIAYSRDINRIKIGDGAHKWSELEYMLSVDAPDYEDIDLSGYAKKEDVATLADHLASMWSLDDDGNLVTEKNVIIKKNLTIGGDTSTGGTGEDTGVSGTVTGIRVDANTVLGPTNGVVDMSDVLANLEVDVDLSDYYTKQETLAEIAEAIAGIDIPSLDGYAKLTDIPSLDGYATEEYVTDSITALNVGQYATKASLETLQGEVDNIEAVLGMDEEAAGIINTWNEVKAFLDGYSSSDDLATILSGMNADIAKRALDSDLDELALTVEDNTTNIRNLKDSVYTKEDLATYKSWWDDLMPLIVKEGNDIKIKTNLIVAGDTSSGGTGSNPEVAGTLIGIKVNGVTYNEPVDGILTIPDYPTSLEWSAIEGKPTKVSEFFNDSGFITSAALVGYATQSWVEGKGYITGITLTGDDYISVNGYQLSLAIDAQGGLENTGQGLGVGNLRYSLTFGSKTFDGSAAQTITAADLGALTSHQSIYGLTIKDSAGGSQLHFNPAQEAKTLTLTKAMVGLGNVEDKSSATIRGEITSANVTNALGYTPANNASLADYLPKSGGTITGNLTLVRNPSVMAFMKNSSTLLGYLGFNNSGEPIMYASDGATTNTLIHSGNIGSQSVSHATTTNRFKLLFDSSATPVDLNTALAGGGILRDYYGGIGRHTNGPTGAGFGSVIEFSADSGGSLSGQLAWDVNYNGEQATHALYWRAGYDRAWTNSNWKTIAFTDSNVAWSQGLAHSNGTVGAIVNSSGNVTIGGSDLAGTTYKMSVEGKVHVRSGAGAAMTEGAGSLIVGYDRVLMIDANDIQAKTDGTTAGPLYINDWGGNVILCGQNNGNVLIGTTTDSGYKLDVNGDISIAKGYSLRNGNHALIGRNSGDNVLINAGATERDSITWIYGTYIVLAPYRGATSALGIDPNGAVTMSSTLSVGGGMTLTGALTRTFQYAVDADQAGNLTFKTNVTEWKFNNSAGSTIVSVNGASNNVGIGVNNPSAKLHVAGNAIITGDTSTGSDIRFKDKLSDHRIALLDIANAPLFTFKWNDREDDSVHLGTSAQYWEKVAPWLVKGEDFKTLDYSTLGVAIGISLANKAVNHEERIKILEKENKALKEQIRRIQYGS